MILVSVRGAEEIGPARALLAALGRNYKCFVLFGKEELRDAFHDGPDCYGFDPVSVVLNANQFDLMVSFGGVLDMSNATQLALLSCFREIGVPTLEIQHTLFQAGLRGGARLSDPQSPGGSSLQPGYAAGSTLEWEGADGIGYLESEQAEIGPEFVRQDQVLITSNNAWSAYGEKERTQFAVAVIKLATNHPDTQFIWRPRPAELMHAEASATFRMVEEYQLENLCIARDELVQELRSRCRLAIGMLSKDLLDYQLMGKPVLIYYAESTQAFTAAIRGRGFRHYAELESLWAEALERPQEFLVDCGIPRLDRARLVRHIDERVRSRRLDPSWLSIALKYVAFLREGRAARIEITKLQPELAEAVKRVGQVETRLAALEEAVQELREQISVIPAGLAGLGQRLTSLQRSTWTYKARKLIGRINRVVAADD